jgi:group II intron reverse transcriptase/maturase
MKEARTSGDMSPGLRRVMERARRNPHERQLALAYLIDVEALRRAFQRIRKDAAVGVDGVSKEEYGRRLEENLKDLHGRLRAMKYRHQPIRRVHIPKDRDRKRPIGISAIEDKIVQGALQEILQAIYEQDFLECSHGFRPKRKPHDALKELNRVVRRGEAQVILEADIKSFFDSLDRTSLLEMLRERIADKSFIRLISKCLHVGVLEGEKFTRPEEGTAQGSILSPILGNIYLHNVLDKWFETEVRPRLKGKATLIRFCDDFVICFENQEDATRVKDVLGKRLGRYKLELHPEKTRLIDFRQPPRNQQDGKGPDSFDFLGFTVYWRRNHRKPGWHLSWKTRSQRQRKTINNIQDLCRSQRHRSVPEQHKALKMRLQGHFNYFGVNGNLRSLSNLRYHAERAWFKWLNRRSQRSRLNWKRFRDLLRDFSFPKPKVYVNLWISP